MRTRREFLVSLGASAALLPLRSRGQQGGKVWRIGILLGLKRTPGWETFPVAQLPGRLKELGYIEGVNTVFEWREAGDYDTLNRMAAELVQSGIDVIVTDGTPGIRAAQAATKTIPIVFLGAADPVASGFVKSLSRPGGNTTGVTILLSDTVGKQLELLVAMVPKVSRLAILVNRGNPAHTHLLEAFRAAAARYKLQLIVVEASAGDEIAAAFVRARTGHADALIWTTDPFLNSEQPRIGALALEHKLPSLSGVIRYPAFGGLMAYGPNVYALYRRVAEYVDRILKGTNPADLPVEQPTNFELVINRKVAKALGLTIPPELLVLADKVIE